MAASLVGSALLSAFLQVPFDRLASPQVVDFFRRRKLDEMLPKKLERKLRSIDALADDAEQKLFFNQHVRAWLLDVRDVVFEAEDLLDEIYELSKCEVEAESQSTFNKVQNLNFFPSFASFCTDINEIEKTMTKVLGDLVELEKRGRYLGLKEVSGVGVGSGSDSKVSQKLSSASLVVESDIYGRDDDKDLIFDWLTSETHNGNKPSILSIVGMGGLGKTTLAQLVYTDSRIESRFDIKVWVCVSDDFDVFNVTRIILEAITKSTDDSRNQEMVQGRLKEKLTGKRFLLVLDDVWNENQYKWEEVLKPLLFGAPGSRILATTRSQIVASMMRSKEHLLKHLEKVHCWELFAKQAFQDGNPQLSPDCKEIGMQIVEKCKGLPLALKTMGSLLYNKSSVWDWEVILKSEIWELEDSNVISALALSYHHLPSHLKKCFTYCALFPNDYEFEKESLIHLWMTENFLQCRPQSKSLEEVGEQYFNDLLSRSFFQPSSIHGKHFVIPGLLNDLAKFVGEDICFILDVDKAKSRQKTTHNFSFLVKNNYYFDGFGSFHDTERLHSFMAVDQGMNSLYGYGWHCRMPICELFNKFKFLHVLSLSHCSDLTELPDSVSRLKYLRSLHLSWTSIRKLPDSTCSLSNLQILKLSHCRDLEELPSDLHLLSNLRRLEFVYTKVRKVPPQLGKLKNLQILMNQFNVGKSRESGIQRLGELNLHGRLSIGELQNIENPSDALEADLKNKTHLVKLDLQWCWEENSCASTKEGDVIQKLQPSEHLKELSIRGYSGEQFPYWLLHKSLPNIVSLTLDDCKSCQSLPPLGLLPFLKHMELSNLDGIVGIDAGFYGNNSSSFTSLETLKFSGMKEWKKWESESLTGAFPRLQCLHIFYCPKLRGHLPRQLPHLRDLSITNCEQLDTSVPWAPEIHKIFLIDCGKLQFHYQPTTLKDFTVIWLCQIEASLVEMVGHTISDYFIGHIISDSITTFSLDFFSELKSFALIGCRNLQMISQRDRHYHLKRLEISNCPRFESLPERMDVLLPFLEELKIEDCPKVESFIDGSLPSNLKHMSLSNCSKLIVSLKGALGANPKLEYLAVGKLDVESFPEEGLLPLSLTSLEISYCIDLKSLDYKGLCSLSSLEYLFIEDCPKLQCLPEEGLPKSISFLEISGKCPMLKQRCQKPEDEDWGKIAHIDKVNII